MKKINNKIFVLFIDAIVILIGIFIYFFRNELLNIFSPCPYHKYLGILCISCGGTRAIQSLFFGDIILALKYNFFIVVLLAYLLFLFVLFNLKVFLKIDFFNKFFKLEFLYIIAILAFVFLIIRNIFPIFHFF